MIEHCSCKTTGQVTDTAIGGCRDMTHMLSDSRNSIVTGRAVTGYTGMIEDRPGKTGGAMANTAILGGRDMGRRLRKRADRIIGAIVARDTISVDARMSECRWRECRCGVAAVAVLVRGHMYDSRLLATGKTTVVTPFAATVDVGMHDTEKSRRDKTARVGVDVTQAAIILRRDMILCLAYSDTSVVAGGAIAAIYADVIEGDTGEGVKEVRTVT